MQPNLNDKMNKTAQHIIDIQNVSKRFGEKTALNNINLFVRKGEFMTILGPSGCGKTTLLRLLAGFETATEGVITISGNDITNLPPYKRNVNTVFQKYALFPHLNVFDNIAFGLKLKNTPKDQIMPKVKRALKMVNMSDYEYRDVNSLSGGQQQRIAIARTLAMDPDIILFDEPTSALDPGMIGEVQAVIRMLAKSGITMMIVTHEMDFARKIASRVLFMDEGGIYEEGTPKEIFEHPQKPNTIKFIKRLTSLTYKIETVDYDFTEAYDELQQYAEKLLIENERISDLQIALEEIVVNNIMEMTDEPQVLVRVDYSEKLDLLTLSIRYQGAHHDPKDSDNELFLEMLEEPTTDVLDQIVEPPFGIYNNLIQINFRWEEA